MVVSKKWIGVYGETTEAQGHAGVRGEAKHRQGGVGVIGKSINWIGVYGESETHLEFGERHQPQVVLKETLKLLVIFDY